LGILFVLSFLFASVQSAYSQQNWIKNFGGALDDKAYAVTIDKAGSIYITGYTTQSGGNIDIITIKLNQNGEQQWSKTFDGAGHGEDKAYAITLDKSNNVIVTGYTTGLSSHHDFVTIKYTTNNGTQVWAATYNAPFNNDDEAHAIICDDSSNVYVTGFITNFGTYLYTIKYNSGGTFQWGKTFTGTGNGDNKAYAITIDRLANIYVTGFVSDTATGYDYSTIKYNLNGVQQWSRIFNGTSNSDDKAYAITVDKAGFIYVTGYTTDTNSASDFTTLKYDSTGILIWNATYNGPGNSDDKAYAITIDSLNNPYVTGSSKNDTTSGSEDYLTIKYNSTSGDTAWTARYHTEGNGPDIPYSILIPKNNSAVFVTGSSWTDTTKGLDIATVKYGLNTGLQLQEKRLNGTGNSDDAAFMLASDTSSNVYITGYESVLNHSYDIFISKYLLGDLISVRKISSEIPAEFMIYQNYPNPFNPGTKIKFELPKSTVVKLAVYDLLGREVVTLINKYMHYGSYELEFNADKLSSGVYFYQLTTDTYSGVKKMIVLK
jgi:uncharacterized delta-60 repeat protein